MATGPRQFFCSTHVKDRPLHTHTHTHARHRAVLGAGFFMRVMGDAARTMAACCSNQWQLSTCTGRRRRSNDAAVQMRRRICLGPPRSRTIGGGRRYTRGPKGACGFRNRVPPVFRNFRTKSSLGVTTHPWDRKGPFTVTIGADAVGQLIGSNDA